jgi:hypothetical protein
MEASELTAAAAKLALATSTSPGGGFLKSLRWVQIMVMMVVIRWISSRCCNLLDIRLAHLAVYDDSDSPLGAVLRFFLPKQKGDPLGSNGGAFMRSYLQRFNVYLCSTFVVCLWLLVAKPYIMAAFNAEFRRLRQLADAAYAAKKRSCMATDREITALALRGLYLFPHITPSGTLVFTKAMTHAAATSNLAEVRSAAGFDGRDFTWHGLVR